MTLAFVIPYRPSGVRLQNSPNASNAHMAFRCDLTKRQAPDFTISHDAKISPRPCLIPFGLARLLGVVFSPSLVPIRCHAGLLGGVLFFRPFPCLFSLARDIFTPPTPQGERVSFFNLSGLPG